MKYLFLMLSLGLFLELGAQTNVKDTTLSIPMFYAAYAAQIPGGDLADRYGWNSNIGGGFMWKMQSNWLIGADFNYLFGKDIKIKNRVMTNLFTENGNIIDQSGSYASFNMVERGYYFTGKFGKVIPVLSPNPNSGIVLIAGIGYLQHKIRIEVLNNTAPQLNGDYKRGYDRLAGGPVLNGFAGYMHLSNKRLLNFFGGFDFSMAFTRPLRDVNFDTMLPDPVQHRKDLLSGFRVGWIFPIFSREPNPYYYF